MLKELNQFKKKGIVILKNVLSKKEIDRTKKKLDEIRGKQKKNRGNSEPLNERAIIGSLEKDIYFLDLIKKKKLIN